MRWRASSVPSLRRERPIRAFGAGLLVLAIAARSAAHAAPDPDLAGIRVAIPDVKGNAAWGGPALGKALRSRLDDTLGGLVSAKELAKAQQSLKQKGAAKTSIDGLVAAGRAAGAQYVLVVDVSKKGWLYTAAARLVNTTTGEQQMDFRAGYYKPKDDAADRGERIARTTIEKLKALKSGGGLAAAPEPRVGDLKDPPAPPRDGGKGLAVDDTPRGGVARVDTLDAPPPPKPIDDRLDVPPSRPAPSAKLDERVDAPPPSGKLDERVDAPPPPPADRGTDRGAGTRAKLDERVDAPPPPPADRGDGARRPADRLELPPDPAPAPAPSAAPSAAAPMPRPSSTYAPEPTRTYAPAPSDAPLRAAPAPSEDTPHEPLRATVLAGSGLLHTLDVRLPNDTTSRLSYQLDPVALFAGEVEAVLPALGLGVQARAAFSPVRFQVAVGDSTDQPSGSMLDLAFAARYHLLLSGQGRDAIRLIPTLGARLDVLSVSEHLANLIHGSTSFAPYAGVDLRMPFASSFEAIVALEGGLVLSFSESPARDGQFGSGLSFGAGLGLRWWLASSVAIALDGRYDVRQINLQGASERQPVAREDLRDLSLGNRDLRLGLGLAFRL